MENSTDQKKEDGRKTSPIRGGKGRNKPGAGRKGENGSEDNSSRSRSQRSQRSEGDQEETGNLFAQFESAAEEMIRRVIEEEMNEAETRILGRLTGRRERENSGREKEAA